MLANTTIGVWDDCKTSPKLRHPKAVSDHQSFADNPNNSDNDTKRNEATTPGTI